MRPILAAAAVVLAIAASSPASPILSIQDIPATYTPGQSVGFNVVLTGAEDLASYCIDIVMTAETAVPGVDAAFVIPAAPVSRYVFGPHGENFAAALNTIVGSQILTLSDFHDPDGNGTLDGVNTVSPINDLIASVAIQTQPNLTGKLYLAISAVGLELDGPLTDPDGVPISINGFAALQAGLATTGPAEVAQVPEPATATLLAALGGLASLRRRRR